MREGTLYLIPISLGSSPDDWKEKHHDDAN